LDIAAEDTVAQRRQAKDEQDAVAEAGAKEEPEEEIVADKQSKTYYPNGCQPAKQIADNNRITFKTITDAEKAGFKLAKSCQ